MIHNERKALIFCTPYMHALHKLLKTEWSNGNIVNYVRTTPLIYIWLDENIPGKTCAK